MTFADWQLLGPEAAAREVRRRVEERLDPLQRRAVFASVLDEAALAAAFAAAPPGSPLRGIPFVLKDMFDVAGLPTFGGSSFLPEVRPAPSSESRVVRALRDAGAVFAGKTHLFEFAWGLTGQNAHYGDCERPGHPGRTSGGSSSGSAVAVAADIVPLAIGTDTGGSIRVPAAFCGLFGFRGVPRDPFIADGVPLAPSFDTIGWFTRTGADMRAAIDALVGLEPSPAQPRGCYLEMPGLEPEVAAACSAAASGFAPPADSRTRGELLERFASAAEVYGVLAGTETWKIHRKWADRYRARYGPLVQDRLERARGISLAQVAAVEPSQAALKRAWADFFQTHDFLVMAATPFPALSRDQFTPANRLAMLSLTGPASLGGYPVLAVPVRLPAGLTCGLQIIVSHPRSPVIPWALDAAQSSA
ncbi:MAG TPA: amidase family protein [Opitutaceae bacterium]|jgi:amidase/aspartyl-tRNA(Asn)/glutamyl-tRNA(Gln) amidotransferase subunit A